VFEADKMHKIRRENAILRSEKSKLEKELQRANELIKL